MIKIIPKSLKRRTLPHPGKVFLMWNHLDLYLHYFTATTTTPDGPISTVTSTLPASTVIPGAESSQLTTKFVKTANGGFVVGNGSLITGRRCYKMWIVGGRGGGQSYGL